jgi:hypothetical protein
LQILLQEKTCAQDSGMQFTFLSLKSVGPSETLVDSFLEMDPEQLERLETALQSEQAKQILGENVTAMLGKWSAIQLYIFLKNGVFWDFTPCGSCKNRRFRGRVTRHNIPEDAILHCHHCENLKSYIYFLAYKLTEMTMD